MKLPRTRRALGLWLALGGTAAIACGYCVEDRIAVVYDHALLQRTLASKHQIAFFAWDGPVTRSEAMRQKILALGEGTAGVDKGSTRVSMEPAALAVAFDPQRGSVQSVQAGLQKALGPIRLSVMLLQPPPAAIKPPG